ncbi:hypothetical protein [Paenibacillus sp. UNC451MF]|uniref:hypothetical protein n=1 Tax=Paenibacillus sp. UNC451MF TaxID=1449063 RepID=UPI000491AFAF|nr:hypothetical protein [Paenibacillus sp. UNC451MF]
MRIIRYPIIILAIILTLTACNTKSTDKKNTQDVLSYDQYVKVVNSIQDKLQFSSAPMKLTDSTLKNPTIIITNKEMTFGKKENLTLRNDFKDSTQYFLTYEDVKNGYKLITGWIYTDVNQGNNLLYFKPDVQGNTGDFNSILSYKNILIHVQLTRLASSSISSEDIVKEHEAVLKDIVHFLETTDPTPTENPRG